MKRRSSVLCLLLAVLMILSMAACTTTTTPSTTASTIPTTTAATKPAAWVSDESLEISMMYADNTAYPFNADWEALKELKKITNVTLKCLIVPDSDYATKVKIVMNSGDMPDLITKMGFESTYALNGTLLPVSDYKAKLPNMVSLLEKWKMDDQILRFTQTDGKYYGFPGFYEAPMHDIALFIRSDLLKKHNLSEPKTYDELYTVLKKLKEQYPDSLPLSAQYNLGLLGKLMTPSFGTGAGWISTDGFKFDQTQDKWLHTASSPEYKTWLVFLNKLFKEKLMDQELFTHSTDQWTQKMTIGKSFVTFAYFGRIGAIEDAAKKSGNSEFALSPLLPLAGPNGKRFGPPMPKFATMVFTPVTIAKKPYFEKFLKFVDWMYYSDKGRDLFNWGIEGKSYYIENNAKHIDKKYKPTINSPVSIDFRKDFGTRANSLSINRDLSFEYEFSDPRMVEFTKNIVNEKIACPIDNLLKLTSDEQEQAKLMSVPLQDYTDKMTMEFIFGKASLDSDWDNYVKECEKKGKDKLLELYNKDWARQKKAVGK